MNQVIICGHLGKKPELKQTDSSAVCHLSVATTRRYKKKGSDDYVEETEWHRVVTWGGLAKNCAKHLDKGRMVVVRGRLKTDKYYDEENSIDRYTTSIVAEDVVFGSKR